MSTNKSAFTLPWQTAPQEVTAVKLRGSFLAPITAFTFPPACRRSLSPPDRFGLCARQTESRAMNVAIGSVSGAFLMFLYGHFGPQLPVGPTAAQQRFARCLGLPQSRPADTGALCRERFKRTWMRSSHCGRRARSYRLQGRDHVQRIGVTCSLEGSAESGGYIRCSPGHWPREAGSRGSHRGMAAALRYLMCVRS